MPKLMVNKKIAGMNSGTVVATMRNPRDLKTHPELAKIFQVYPAIVKKISESMGKDGFDQAEPLVIWREEDAVVDGHQRREAAIMAGLSEVPVTYKSFATLEDAKIYCWKRQADRRNLTQAELFEVASVLNIKTERDGTGRSSETLAKQLGVSASTIQHARTVAAKADDETIEAVKKGEKTINEAYESVRQKKTPKKSAEQGSSEPDESAAQRRNLTTLDDNPFDALANDPFDAVEETKSAQSFCETLYQKIKNFTLQELAHFLNQIQSDPIKTVPEWIDELNQTER